MPFSNKKGLNTDTCNDTDKTQTHYAKKKVIHRRLYTV